MATVVRGPLYVSQRSVEPFRLATLLVVVPSLLCTVLAQPLPIPLPVGAAHSFPLQAQVNRGLFPNPDTSHGTPKTLLPPDPRQRFLPLQLPPQARPGLFPNPDTSKGKPKVQLADQIPPRFDAPPPGPSAKPIANWLPADTTQDQPLTLQPVAVAPTPAINAPPAGPIRNQWQPADTTGDTPKTLLAEITLPFGVLQQTPPDRPRAVTDTTQDSQPYLLTSPLPRAGTAFVGLPRFWWQPADTSAGMPKAFPTIAAAPFEILQQSLTNDPIRSVTDTSQGTAAVLRGLPLPDGATTQLQFSPLWPWLQLPDMSQGMAKVLYADASIAFVNLPYPTPDNIRPVTDTSQSAFALITPPGVVVVVPPPVVEDIGGKGKPRSYRRRIQVEIDGEVFEVRSEAEGIRLLMQARELAKNSAAKATELAANKAASKTSLAAQARAMIVPIPQIRLIEPDYSDPLSQQIQASVDAAQADIEAIYRAAIQAARIHFAAMQQDEDEAIMLLLLS